MNLRSTLLATALSFTVAFANAQSKTTEDLQKKHTGALSLFFYNNTLRMINQTADPAFDELIKDIKKMKFLMINKAADKFDAVGYKKLVSDYKSENFEEIMTSRFQGKNFDVFLKGSTNETEGMLVLVNDSESLFVLDILGRINVNKVTDLYKQLDGSSEIGEKIKAFTNRGGDRSESDRKEKSENDH